MNWQGIRQQVLKQDNNQCVNCYEKADDVHHIIPRRKNGLNVSNNLMSVCEKCHGLLELKVLKKITSIPTSVNIGLKFWKEVKKAAIDEGVTATEFLEEALKDRLAKTKTKK